MNASSEKVTEGSPGLATTVAGISMRNPVMVASGTFGYGPEYADLVDLNALGAMVVKGISSQPVKGNNPPRTVEVASGLINAIGLQNPGVDGFVEQYMPFLRQYDVPVIVNAWGRTVEEYVDVVSRLAPVEGIAGFEVNVSCPNIKEGGHLFGTAMEGFSAVLTAVRDVTDMPLIVKLSPNVADIGAFARRAQDLGMDAVSLINSLPAMAIDVETRRPVLGNVTGGLSGPAIHPVALKLVWEAARAVDIPVIAMGGITEAKDALDFFIAGASAVAVGTANFTDPLTVLRVIDGLRAYLADHGHADINEIVGTLQV